jgi:hypothetical protein
MVIITITSTTILLPPQRVIARHAHCNLKLRF